jgi:hypothetical protein
MKESGQGFRIRLAKAIGYTVIGLAVGFWIGFATGTVFAGELKLPTHGMVLTEVERIDGGYGSLLVEIQGEVYAVVDTRFWKLRRMRITVGDIVQVVFTLNEEDRVSEIQVVGTI